MPVVARTAWVAAILIALLCGTSVHAATKASILLRAYDRTTGALIPQLSIEDVRLFAGSKELTVTNVVRDSSPIDIWILPNGSPVVRDAVGDPMSFAKDLFARLQPGDRMHWDPVCAENASGREMDEVTLPGRIDASFAKLAKEEPVIECLQRFGRSLPQSAAGRRRHFILLADDTRSRSSANPALAHAVASLGAPISILHYVENRKRTRRGGGWTDIPIPPPPGAPVHTAHPPPRFPDRNSFQVFADYSAGDLVRIEPGKKYSVGEAIDRLRQAYVLEFQREEAKAAADFSIGAQRTRCEEVPNRGAPLSGGCEGVGRCEAED